MNFKATGNRIFSFFLMLTFGAQVSAQCLDNVARTTSDRDFEVGNDSWVTDLRSQLMWKRCAEGRTVNANSGACVGLNDSDRTWQQALQYVVDLNQGTAGDNLGFTDWRLPSVKELVSVLEFGCGAPAVNPTAFRGFGGGTFWTSTTSPNAADSALTVQLGNGRTLVITKDGDSPILGSSTPSMWLVRSAEP